MRLTSFFLVILLLGLTLLGYHTYRLQGYLDATKSNYLEFADSFLKGSKQLAVDKFEEQKAHEQFYKNLAINSYSTSDQFTDNQNFTLVLHKNISNLKSKILEKLDLIANEITKDLLPDVKVEKNETINSLQEKVPTQFQLAFIEFFDTQKFNRSDVGLLVNCQNILNDLSLIKMSILDGQSLTANKLEYLLKINDFRFQEMQKLNLRHVIKLKLQRLRVEFRSVLSGAEGYFKDVKLFESQKTFSLKEIEMNSSRTTQEFLKVQENRVHQQKAFSKKSLDKIKSEMKISFIAFALGLIVAFFILYLSISRPLNDYLKSGKTKNNFLFEIEKLISKIEDKHRENLSLQQDVLKNEKYASIGSVIHLVSHELKNPLSIMQLSIDDLKEQANEATIKELQNIESMLDRMNELIKNLSRLGKIEAIEESFDVMLVIRQIEGMFARVFAKENIQFEVKSNDDVILMDGLKEYVEIILLNLISNAIRAMEKSPDKQILIQVTKENEKVHLTVKDTGEGIDTEMMNLLFEPYMTSKKDNSISGLGLNIVKNAVEKLNGTIAVHSQAGQGAEFIIEI